LFKIHEDVSFLTVLSKRSILLLNSIAGFEDLQLKTGTKFLESSLFTELSLTNLIFMEGYCMEVCFLCICI